MTKISQLQFKQLIFGENSVNGLWPHHSIKPDIRIHIGEDRISISGDFEMSEDLVFNHLSNIEKELFFNGGNYRNIVFIGGRYAKVTFRNGNYYGFVSIRGGRFNNILLLGGTFQHWLGTLDGLNNSEDGLVKLAEDELIINRFIIEGGSYANGMWISGGKIDSLEIKCVTSLKLHCKPNDDKVFEIEEDIYKEKFSSVPKIKNLIISRYSNKDNFYHFSGLEMRKIEFENFTNLGNITISKVKLEKSITIQNSDLGKTTFIDCNFANQSMFFDSSKINEIALAGSLLPEPSKIISINGNLSQKKLALSQIKKVYQNMGDSLTAVQYQSQELDIYKKTLKFNWEKINLILNSISNRHGQSWSRALFLLFCTSVITYTLYCLALGFKIDISANGYKYFFKNAGYLLEFINPIRKSDFLPKTLFGYTDESKIPVKAIVIDSFAKIINAYLLYQFIAAFRKHGKKTE